MGDRINSLWHDRQMEAGHGKTKKKSRPGGYRPNGYMMLALSGISLELADRSGHRVNSVALNQAAIQAKLGAQATVEYGLWQLTQDLSWRTAAEG